MASDLQQLHDRWNELGENDPLWSVLTDPTKTGGRWSEDEFFATGRVNVAGLLEDLGNAGIDVRFGRAIDFGCGVGRLTQALAAHFDSVVGIDIATSMVSRATSLDRTGGRATYIVNRSHRLEGIESASADLVYSSIVLQHTPPTLSRGYVAEFLRVLRPGGIAVFDLPSGPRRARGYLKQWLKRLPRPMLRPLLALTRDGRTVPIDMSGVPRRDVESAVVSSGGDVVSVLATEAAGPDWTGLRYTIRRPMSG